MAANKKSYLVMALEQDMKHAGYAKNNKTLMKDLKRIDEKLADPKNKHLTLEERFVVQYAATQSCLHEMRRDGEQHLDLDMEKVDQLTDRDLEEAKQQKAQEQRSAKVLDIRDRLPKQVNAAAAGMQLQLRPPQPALDAERLDSTREYESVMTEFLDLYHQLMAEKEQLIQYEREKIQLMREYNISEEQLERISSPVESKTNKTEDFTLTQRHQKFFQRLEVIELKKEKLVGKILQRVDNIDRFYRDNMTLEEKLKLKAALSASTLGPTPQLRLQNALRLSPMPTPRPGAGKKKEEEYQPRPKPPTPRPL